MFLPLGLMFVATLLLGTVALHIFSTEQMAEESGPAVRSARSAKAHQSCHVTPCCPSIMRHARMAVAYPP